MTFVFNPPAIGNILFKGVMESLKINLDVMSCGFLTTIPETIAITVFTLGELENDEIEEIKRLLNTLLSNEHQKNEWDQFLVQEYVVTDSLRN